MTVVNLCSTLLVHDIADQARFVEKILVGLKLKKR